MKKPNLLFSQVFYKHELTLTHSLWMGDKTIIPFEGGICLKVNIIANSNSSRATKSGQNVSHGESSILTLHKTVHVPNAPKISFLEYSYFYFYEVLSSLAILPKFKWLILTTYQNACAYTCVGNFIFKRELICLHTSTAIVSIVKLLQWLLYST